MSRRGGRVGELDARFTACRTWQHAWEPTTVEVKGGQYWQGLRCMRCGSERSAIIDAYGHRVGDRRKYPEGYLLKGGGGLTIEERAELRLFEVTGHLGGRDELAARRRRRSR